MRSSRNSVRESYKCSTNLWNKERKAKNAKLQELNDDISRVYKLEGGKSRKELAGGDWIGTLEGAILSYIHDNGLIRFTIAEIAKALGIDNRRVHDAVKRLMNRGVFRKHARGLYEVTEAFIKFLDYKIRRIKSVITRNRPVKENHDTRGPRVGNVGFCNGDPLFFDHVMGVRGGRYVNGEHGRICWRDLVFFDSIKSAEVGAFVDIIWDGVLKIYQRVLEPRPVVEWLHPSGFMEVHTPFDLRRFFWVRVTDAAIGLAKLVLEDGPPWAVKRLLKGLRGFNIC